MGNQNYVNQIEKKIKGKIMGIKFKTMRPVESNIVYLFGLLEPRDEALHSELMTKYKKVLYELKMENGNR